MDGDAQNQRRLRRRVALFVLAVVVIVGSLAAVVDFVRTLDRLDAVERERDGWQRPRDVLTALDVHPGDEVAELGCGAGYFTLKLAQAVGEGGEVIAVDVRRLPLVFLWARTRSLDRVRIEHVAPDDPELPIATLDAVLIANTYHELEAADATLTAVHAALRPGGRLVLAERGPRAGDHADDGADAHEHASSAIEVERALRAHGFAIVERRDAFIDVPGDDAIWWLLIARRP